jgi:hypothetical protein
MKRLHWLFTVSMSIALSLEPSAICADDSALSFANLISQRQRLDRTRVSVTGYFDAKKMLLFGSPQDTRNPVVIDLTATQQHLFKASLKSAYVRVVGTFEYVGGQKIIGPIKGDPEHRIAVLSPAGFGNGSYTMRLTKITQFAAATHP